MATQSFTTTGSWTAPPGVTSVTAECWGGGGAGGVASGTASGAGGGAGGQYAKKVVSVTPGNNYTVTVATAAIAVTTGGVVTNGTDSWFSTTGTVIAKGGAGGADATGATGAGGTGSTTGGIGDTVFAGGSGATGVSSTQSGGGGGGAGSTGTGNSGSGATAGAATSLNGGAGGNGVSTANTQNNGQNYGGGGSGGLSSSATNRKGGDGAPGLVILTWDINPGVIGVQFVAPKIAFPPFPKKLISSQYQHNRLPPFVPVAATAIYIEGGPSGTISYQTLSYPSEASSPLPLTLETVTLDKWWRPEPRPFFISRRLPYYPNVVVAKEDVPTVDRWPGQNIRPVFIPQRVPRDFTVFRFTPSGAAPNPLVYIDAGPAGTIYNWTMVYPSQSEPLRQVAAAPLVPIPYQDIFVPRRTLRVVRDITVRDTGIFTAATPTIGWYQPQPVPVSILKKLRVIYPQFTIDAAFFLVPSAPTDFLAPSKDIDSIILLTADSQVLTLTIQDVNTLSAINNDTDSLTLITQDVDSL